MIISGCSKQAIVLKGPGAVLRAKSVTFRDHGPADTSEAAAGTTLPSLGLIIAATDAVVELTNVTIAQNNGMRLSRNSRIPSWRPYLHLPCRDDTVSGGVSSSSSNTSGDVTTKQQACGSPLLGSSLIDLEESTLVLRGTKLQDNTADALITARGSSAHALQLLPGTVLAENRARWLLVADSWAHDPVGRRNMKAPQPSEGVTGLDMEPPYTSYALMGQLRSQMYAEVNDTGNGARRRLLQQQQAGQQTPQSKQGQRMQQQRGSQQQAAPQKRTQQQGQQQQHQKQPQELQEVPQSLQQPPQQPLQQQPGVQEPEQPQVTPDSVVGKAPNGQVSGGVDWQAGTNLCCAVLDCNISRRAVSCCAGAAAAALPGSQHQPQHRPVRSSVAAPCQHQLGRHCDHAQHRHRRQRQHQSAGPRSSSSAAAESSSSSGRSRPRGTAGRI